MNIQVVYKPRSTSLIIIFLFTLCPTISWGQGKLGLYTKYFGLKSNISSTHNDIIIDHQGNIITANAFGIEIFNGLRWVRKDIFNINQELPLMRVLVKSKVNPKEILIAGKYKAGIIKNDKDRLNFQEVLNQSQIDTILGGYVIKIIEHKQKIFFLGLKSSIIYDRLNGESITLKSNKDIGWLFNYYKIGESIIFLDARGETFSIKNNSWVKVNDYPLLNKYVPHLVVEIDRENMFLISRKGQVYFHNHKTGTQKNIQLSQIFKNNYYFKSKRLNNKLFIKSNKQLVIIDLTTKKVVFQRTITNHFLTGFDIDQQGNFWVSSSNGVFFIESNIALTSNTNIDISQKKYLDQLTFEIKKNNAQLTIKKDSSEKFYDNLSRINQIKQIEDIIFICTNKGLYSVDKQTLTIQNIYAKPVYFVLKSKNLFYLFGDGYMQLLDKKFEAKEKIKLDKIAVSGILYKGYIYYSTSDQVFYLKLSDFLNNTKKPVSIKFPRKTSGDFCFEEVHGRLFVNNSKGIFEVTKDKVIEITQNLKGEKKSNNDKVRLISFSYVFYEKNGAIFAIPVLGGEHNGENIPGYLIKNKEEGYAWHNKPFKRMGKYELLGIAKTPRNTYEFITNDHIIEYDPNKKVNTDYAFKAYIRSAQVKVKQVDSTSGKEALRDSSIYYGNLANPPAVTLPYPQNTLTFTYASDSWAAYERNLYSYQLMGLDEGWSDWSTEQKKEYTHLREGTYTFRVRCKNVYGTISSVDSYTFTILPPWHRTMWAYALYVLAGLALLIGGSYGYSRYRSRQLYRRNQHLEIIVAERTEEIQVQKEAIEIANEELTKANERLRQERDEKVKIYMQEATEAANKLQKVRNTLNEKGIEAVKRMIGNEIEGVDEFAIVREKVHQEFPAFAEMIDQAFIDKKVTKLVWQVGHCLKLGMSPMETGEVLSISNRSVSVHGTKLRKLGILEPIKKS